ncbi:FAD-binding oxidoreductase [Salinarimonas ramus]|uniref:FAD-linked oxidase n=1 Tax=Salinarimonas ramus TaxID=690164 RepID=A0A917V2D8_9HYPH|nr:FAD-binding oxidoreductase [Salinarimonas ramus]GGK21759.1 FAD-linked oxidase [Salinarimonas ramus]
MSAVLDDLHAALGADCVRAGADIPARAHADASGVAPTRPLALVLPRDVEGVSRALAICHAHGQPIVTQGGMTGLAGGAHPYETDVALSLERLTGIEEIDVEAGTLTARAGTPLQVLQEAAEEAGFMLGIDLGARGSCTIGGNVSTNAGGNNVLRYGMTRRNVLGLEAVLADGTVVSSLNKMLKNNSGYDWTQLMIGSEGTLGVVTRVVLALQPRPEGVRTALCAVSDTRAALRLLRVLERRFAGGLLVFEGMWRDFMEAATREVGLAPPFAEPHELLILVEAATGEGEAGTARFEEVLGAVLEDGLVVDAIVAQSESDRARLWAYRESPYEYQPKLPVFVSFDVSFPRGRIGEAVADMQRAARAHWPDALSVVFGHIADSNLHLIVGGPGIDKKAVEERVYGIVASYGGAVSAEHGIGRNKRAYLALSRSEPELALMRTIKRALDPADILNRGRVL